MTSLLKPLFCYISSIRSRWTWRTKLLSGVHARSSLDATKGLSWANTSYADSSAGVSVLQAMQNFLSSTHMWVIYLFSTWADTALGRFLGGSPVPVMQNFLYICYGEYSYKIFLSKALHSVTYVKMCCCHNKESSIKVVIRGTDVWYEFFRNS